MDKAKQNLYDFQMKRFEIFKSQDPENKQFDVVFDYNGKKLYANKFTLFSISSTFESMLSERWSKPEEPIIVKDYSFDDFKEFLTFIYSGECEVTNDNIFAMVDLAEFYGVQIFKNYCEEFLTKIEINQANVYQMIEFSEKYSLIKFKNSIYDFISKNLLTFLKDEQFMGLEKSTIKEIVEFNCDTKMQEELFEAVYKWAENQALKKQNVETTLEMNDAIKEELSAFLTLMKFGLMSNQFLIKFVVRKSFLFTDNQLNNFLWKKDSSNVTIIDKNGKEMKGLLQCDNNGEIFNIIRSMKNICCSIWKARGGTYYYWNTNYVKPATPSTLFKKESIEWYLVFDEGGDLAIMKQKQIKSDDYFLAEMFAEHGFELDAKCKIEIA